MSRWNARFIVPRARAAYFLALSARYANIARDQLRFFAIPPRFVSKLPGGDLDSLTTGLVRTLIAKPPLSHRGNLLEVR